MKHILLAVLGFALALCLLGCRSSAGELPQTQPTDVTAGALPVAEETVGIHSTDLIGDDEVDDDEEEAEHFTLSDSWKAPYTFRDGTIIQDGEEKQALFVITPESIIFYEDDSMKIILGYADLPEAVKGLPEAEQELDTLDLDGDGWSDIMLNLRWLDGRTASLLWNWTEEAGYTFNSERSRLPE